MKLKLLKSLIFLVAIPAATQTPSNGSGSYMIGGIVMLIILGFLMYNLIHPKKY